MGAAVEKIEYDTQLAEGADKIRPKYKKYKETPTMTKHEVKLSDLNSFISKRGKDEQKLLRRLTYVATTGKDQDYQFQYFEGAGTCTGLLVVLNKSGGKATVIIARMKIEYEIANARLGISTKQLNGILENYIKRQTTKSLTD